MIFFTKKGDPLIDSAIHNANWIIANDDFQNRLAKYNYSQKIFLFDAAVSIEIILFNPLPFTRKNDIFSYKDSNSPLVLFINKNKLHYKAEKIAIALVNEFLNSNPNCNLFEDYLLKCSSSVVTTIVEELIKEKKIIVF